MLVINEVHREGNKTHEPVKNVLLIPIVVVSKFNKNLHKRGRFILLAIVRNGKCYVILANHKF